MESRTDKLTTRELAAELKRTPETLVRWRRERQGPPYQRIGAVETGRVLYDRREVEQWLDQQRPDWARPVQMAPKRVAVTVLGKPLANTA